MSSMSYCELQNAAGDLDSAVYDAASGQKDWSRDELEAAKRIVELAKELGEYIEAAEAEREEGE